MRGRHGPVLAPAAGVLVLILTVRCTSGKQPPLAVRNPLADSADQVLYKTKSVLTDGGVMKAEVYGDTAYVFDDNTRVEMRGVRTIFFTATGARNAVLTSREGTYNTRTNNMEARGDVVVVSEDGRRLTTPVLRFAQSRNEISSDTSFTLTDPTRDMTGIGFVSDPDMNNMRCLKACAGSAGTVNLPGGPGDSARAPNTVAPRPPSAGGGAASSAHGAAPSAAAGRAPASGRSSGALLPAAPSSSGGTSPGRPPSSAAAAPAAGQPAPAQPKASPAAGHPSP